MLMFIGFFFILAAIGAVQEIPTVHSFESRTKLTQSGIWQDTVELRNLLLHQTSTFYIHRERAYLLLARVVSRARPWMPGRHSDVEMVEVRLEDGLQEFEVANFPLVTLSADLSTSGAQVEREVTDGFGITLSFMLDLRFKLDGIHETRFTFGLSSTFSTALTQKLVCRAPAGGRVQMQASTRMVLFPRAIMRNVTYKAKSGTFVNGEWTNITSTVLGESVDGALLYSSDYFGRHRCVTDPTYFEDMGRLWLPDLEEEEEDNEL